jgi:flagellar biosynthesis protein FlhF
MSTIDTEKPVVHPIQGTYSAYRKDGSVGPAKNRLTHSHVRELYAVYLKMLNQGVEEHVALDLAAGLNRLNPSGERLTSQAMKAFLIDVFDAFGIAIEPIKFNQGHEKVVALVGPTGVGKTTTAAKIAAVARYRQSQKQVALITIDNYRVGGSAQLEKYAEIIGIPFRFAANKKSLMQALNKLKSNDLILVDTPGVSLRNVKQVEELRWMLAKIRHLETHLLLSATTKEEDMIDAIDKFGAVSIDRLIFTKIDESRTYGNVLNQLIKSKIPVSYFTKGQQVPEDIETATQEKIVDLILKDTERSDVWSKPPEVLAMEIERFRTRLIASVSTGDSDETQEALNVAPLDIFGDVPQRRFAGAL